MKNIIYLLLFLIGNLVGFGCTSEEGVVFRDSKGGEDQAYKRTVLVYMVESNLGPYLQKNVSDLTLAATKKNLGSGHLVVFYSKGKDDAELFEIKDGADGKPTKHHIRDYEGSAVDNALMARVISDVKNDYPSDGYGLILSSHGTAWLPRGYSEMLRSFGEEERNVMEIQSLVEAIPDGSFDFLLFDACSMGTIECIYELKDKAEYIVSSPSEILVDGFPYAAILPYFFKEKAQMNKVAEGFFTHYMGKPEGSRYANVSVVDTKELGNLAGAVKEILSGKTEEDWFVLSLETMQLLSYLPGAPIKLYDFDDIIRAMATDEQYAQFKIALDKAIPVKYSTLEILCKGDKTGSEYYYVTVDVEGFSGLSAYPLHKGRTQLNGWYKTNLSWPKAVF